MKRGQSGRKLKKGKKKNGKGKEEKPEDRRKQVAKNHRDRNRDRNQLEGQGSSRMTRVYYVPSVREHTMMMMKQHGSNAQVVHSGSTLVAQN